MADESLWPEEIRLSQDKRRLEVTFGQGRRIGLDAEYLRVFSPSAEVQGHHPSERKTVPGKCDVTIRAVEPVGNYAIRLVFDDGHATGIYGWSYLAELARRHDENWRDYLGRLAAQGLSRS